MSDTGPEIVVNPDNGEFLGIVVRDKNGLPKRLTTKLSTPYITAFIPALQRLATDRGLVGTDFRVLLYVASLAPINTPDWDASPQMIGDALGIDRQRVSRSLRRLINRKYLTRPARGKIGFSPMFAWRGNSREREYRIISETERARLIAEGLLDDQEAVG